MKTRGCLQCRHKTLFYIEKFLDKTGFTSSKGGYCRKANKIFNVSKGNKFYVLCNSRSLYYAK